MIRFVIIFFIVFLMAINSRAEGGMAADFKELIAAIKAVSGLEGTSSAIGKPVVTTSPQTTTFSSTQPLVSLKTSFLRNSATIDESIQVNQGPESKNSRFILDNEGRPLEQALLSWQGMPVQVYDRQDETFAYMQMPDNGGGVSIKEWIYARQPNCAEGTCFNWKINGDMHQVQHRVLYWSKVNTKIVAGSSFPSFVKEGERGSLKIKIHEPASSYPLLIDPTLSWGQWMGGTSGGIIYALTTNGSSIYAGGYAVISTGWNNLNVTFAGVMQSSHQAYVAKITDNGASPTLTWGQWLGGTGTDFVRALATHSSIVYAGGYSSLSTGWNNQTVTFAGVCQNTGDCGFVVSITDNGATPTLNWGQWLGGQGSEDEVLGMGNNGGTIYAGGFSTLSSGWNNQTVTFAGVNQAIQTGWVVSIKDNGTTPTLKWGQWLGGTSNSSVQGLTNNGTTIYAGGFSLLSTGWNSDTVTFQGVMQSTEAGFVAKITDNGTTPTLNWGQWIGGTGSNNLFALTMNGSNVYAGGQDTLSTGWNNQNVTFQGVMQETAAAYVVKVTDNGATPTLKWGQWLGGVNQERLQALALNGSSVYAIGFSSQSTGWNNQNVTFTGTFEANEDGYVVKITDNGTTPTLKWGQWQGGRLGGSSTQFWSGTAQGGAVYASGYTTLSTGWNNEGGSFYGVAQSSTPDPVTKTADDSDSLWFNGMGF